MLRRINNFKFATVSVLRLTKNKLRKSFLLPKFLAFETIVQGFRGFVFYSVLFARTVWVLYCNNGGIGDGKNRSPCMSSGSERRDCARIRFSRRVTIVFGAGNLLAEWIFLWFSIVRGIVETYHFPERLRRESCTANKKWKIKYETFRHGENSVKKPPLFQTVCLSVTPSICGETGADGLTLVSLSSPFASDIRRPNYFTFARYISFRPRLNPPRAVSSIG